MIYQPQVLFNVYAAVGQAVIAALARAAVDYIRGEGQPWAYYLGYGVGGAALATGIPGAQAILYLIGSGTVKIVFEKSPGAAEAQIFLDGVSEGNVDLADETIDFIEFIVNIPNDGQYHSLSILNLGTIELDDPTHWLSILAIEAADAFFAPQETPRMAVYTIGVTLRDAKTVGTARVKNKQSCSIHIPQGTLTVAQLETWHDAFVTAIDAVSGSVVESSQIIMTPTLPGGLKTVAEAGNDVQEGALFSFDLGNGYSDGFRVPGLKAALFGTDGQSVPIETVTVIEDLRDLLIGVSIAGQPGSDRNGIAYAALNSAKKSFRK